MSDPAQTGVLCVGRLYCDLIFTGMPRLPSYGTEVFADGFGVHVGGGAFITAAHLAALGQPASLATLLPNAPFSELVLPGLHAAGVDLGLSHPMPAGTEPQVTVALAGTGDRAFVTRRSGPAFPDVTAADLTRAGIGHVHIGELATLLERPSILDTARAAGATISLDCGWDEAIRPADAAPFIAAVDVFLPNEDEAAWLAEDGVTAPFAPLTVVKCGTAGARAQTCDAVVEVAAAPVEAIDTTGAGDAFNAGFLACWLKGQALRACLAAGNARGALAVTGRGGFQAEPTRLRPAANLSK